MSILIERNGDGRYWNYVDQSILQAHVYFNRRQSDDNNFKTVSAKCSTVCRNNSIYASMSFGNQRNRNSSAEKLRFPTGSWVFSRAFQLAFRYRWLDESRGGTKETDGEATRSRSFLCDRFHLHWTNALLRASVKAEMRVIIMSFAFRSKYGFCIYLGKMASKSQIACLSHVQLLLFV